MRDTRKSSWQTDINQTDSLACNLKNSENSIEYIPQEYHENCYPLCALSLWKFIVHPFKLMCNIFHVSQFHETNRNNKNKRHPLNSV